jgi:hypothetical protein
MTRADVKTLVLALTDPDRKPPLENETAERRVKPIHYLE